MEKDAYYFPHFCNARHDRKILRLRRELGVEGYGIFFMLLEVLREQIDFCYPMKDLDLLADQFNTSESKIRVVICNYQLFQLDENEQFFSPKLLIYLQPYFSMKEQRKLAGIKSGESRRMKLLEESTNDRSTDVQRMLNENEQSKEKKSKEKENKEDILGSYSSNTDLIKVIKDFKDMRTKAKKPMTDRALQLILKGLDKLTTDDETKIKILEQSIVNSWLSVYPLKQGSENKSDGYNAKPFEF